MTPDVFLFLSAFLASAVEMVEALTIVLAVGVTRGWRSALIGVGAALARARGARRPRSARRSRSVPIDALRVVVGALLLVFGLQWLRKAILRASGYKALHDEDAIFAEELAEARGAARRRAAGVDWYCVHGRVQGRLPRGPRGRLHRAHLRRERSAASRWPPRPPRRRCSSSSVVGVARARAAQPRARERDEVHVGLMLTTFGTFWGAEGAGARLAGRATRRCSALLAFLVARLVHLGARAAARVTARRPRARA